MSDILSRVSEPKTIGELIRERRLARGLSLGQLATAVGRTAATVRAWERGQHSPAHDVLGRLAVALEVDEDELEAAMYREPPSLTVVADTDGDEVTSEDTSVSGEASIETAEGEGDDETAEIGPVESEPAAAAETEPQFEAASADELGVMPRIEVPSDAPVEAGGADASADETPVEIEIIESDDAPDAVEEAEISGGLEGDEPVDEAVVDVVLDEPDDAAAVLDESDDGRAEDLVDEPTAAIGPPIAPSPVVESGNVGVAVKAEMLQEPSLPPFLAPLRAIFDPSRKWLYWIRGTLTVAAMIVMLLVLAWAAGELFDGLGEVLDTIESTDEVASSLDI